MKDFLIGDRIKIKNPISQMEKDLVDVQLFFHGTEPTHGYAKVIDIIGGVYWVHPESIYRALL